MKTLGYYNGKFGPLEEMTVPMNDRACYFGDGVYEGKKWKDLRPERSSGPFFQQRRSDQDRYSLY